MAKAIIAGLIANTQAEIAVSSPSLPEDTSQRISTHHNNLAIIHEAELIIVAVKPVKVAEVLTEIAQAIPPQSVLVSVAAGINLKTLARFCRHKQAIVRCMPNLAAAVAKSATPLIANKQTSLANKNLVTDIFNQIGISHWVDDESILNAFTALSGSGPAYVFLLMDSMINAAIKLGLDEQTAQQFSLQTIQGAAALVEQSHISPSELISKVTSPAGTTAAALEVLQQGQFDQILFKAMQAACDRAAELSEVK